MRPRTYILVFRETSAGRADDMKRIVDVLDQGDRLFAFDVTTAFIETRQNVESLTAQLRGGPLRDALFFLADITDTSRAGNMVPAFWDMLHAANAQIAPADA